MGRDDGRVLGLTKIYDSGLPSLRWNLVLVAEGYTASEQATFRDDAQEFLDHMLRTPPFDEDEIACAMNVYRLDVVSDESGADDPVCDGTGTGTTANTYFDASHCYSGDLRRQINGAHYLVLLTLENVFPEWHHVIVLVNSPIPGGSAFGPVGWVSTSGRGDWRDTSIHELGHATFGLADEYDYYTGEPDEEGQDDYTGSEPAEPNVTTQPDPAAVKWAGLVTAGPDSPTLANPDCGETAPGRSPFPDDTVGTFEGAFYHHCGAYRPQHACMMRNHDDFCAICLAEIRRFFAAFALPAPSGAIRLVSDEVHFRDVPVNLTARRAVTFEVDSCLPVTFVMRSSVPEPFALVSSSETVASPSGPTPWRARVWFEYTCDTPGATPPGEIVLRCLETFEDFPVTLVGNCIERPRVAAQLVFDQSSSMHDMTDEGRTKEDLLRDAAGAFADLLYDNNGIGLNTYDHDPHPVFPVREARRPGDGGGRDDLLREIRGFSANPSGLTAIGDGIELAKERLDDATAYPEHAMVVLTDGIETADKRIEHVADSVINQEVFAIGLGTGSQIETPALDALTKGTGGYLLLTGLLSEDETFLLSEYYLQILAGLNNDQVVVDPVGYLRPGTETRIPFDVTDSDVEITAAVLAAVPDAVELALEAPDGTVVDDDTAALAPDVDHRPGTRSVFIRTSVPPTVDGTLPTSGRWHMRLRLNDNVFTPWLLGLQREDRRQYDEAVAHGLKYAANVYAYSSLRFESRVLQASYDPGTELTVRARLTESDAPFEGYVDVRSELTRPDGTDTVLVLTETDTGVYEASVTADDVGVYRFRTVADGRTEDEQPFTREQLSTAPVWMAGTDEPVTPPDRDGGLCRLLACLVESEAIGSEAREWLDESGVDVDALYGCLCGDRPSGSSVDASSADEFESAGSPSSRLLEESTRTD